MNIRFNLKLYQGKKPGDEPDYEATGEGEEWTNYTSLKFPGFDGSVVISLEDFWHYVLSKNLNSHQQLLEGRETIVKFGNVTQLKEYYTAIVEIEYLH